MLERHQPQDGRDEPWDEDLMVARLQAGDATAFEVMVRTHGGRLLAVARRLLGNEEDARDAVQDAFVSAFRGIRRFEGSARISTWLHRIVVNTSLMKLRTRQRRPEDSIEALLPRFTADGHQAEPVSAWPVSAEQLLGQREARELVRRSIAGLPDIYRTILVLRDIEELSSAETAQLLGTSINAVKSRLHRARQALATKLGSQFGAQPFGRRLPRSATHT